jgi:single-stranded-DNA-specific exonuclease
MVNLPLTDWEILNTDTSIPIIDVLLKNRGLTKVQLEDFKLSERLHDPFLLTDMKEAVERIKKAIEKKETITVFGDYDVDGVVSTTLMIKFFNKVNISANFVLPSRQDDGYGLKISGVEKAKELKTDLLITVDNGITSVEAVEFANELGIDVIIFDHHIQEGDLPNAYAVVNPNRKDSSYPFSGLCGAGVVYKFFHAIAPAVFSEDEFRHFMLMHLDLVALATIADVVPLRDENYFLVKVGLKSLNQTLRPGIVELKRVAGLIGKEITPISVGFYLAPRLNVAGRLRDAEIAARLLLSETREEAAQIANRLNSLNKERQQMQESYIHEAIRMVDQEGIRENAAYIVKAEAWDPGLIGIVSGRLKDIYNRPVIALSKDNSGNYVGSGRSTDSFHLTNALSQFSDLYITYGGHHKAAGLTIAEENVDSFIQKFTAYANSTLSEKSLRSKLVIDSVIIPEQLNNSMVRLISEIGPFGEENPEPLLLLQNARIKEMFSLSQGKHIKIVVQIGSRDFECVWWRRGDLKDVITFNQVYDIAFKPSLNPWNGRENLQLVVEDMRPASNI